MMSGETSPNNNARTNLRHPFTATQWQELEHQALIFKYMISGLPIPPQLFYAFKTRLDPSISYGYGAYDTGFGRKIDPEPGRCRRTDGKKWRCSKEAYTDSKYCDRHMHRGKNRSRKPVEASSSSTSSSFTTNSNTIPSYNSASMTKMFASSLSNATPQTQHQSSSLYPFISMKQGSNTNPQLLLNSECRDYRYVQGAKEGVDNELAFFPAESTSANARSFMSSSQSELQSLTGHYPQQPSQTEQHCYVLGTDFKSSRPMNEVKEEADQIQKSLRHFFGST